MKIINLLSNYQPTQILQLIDKIMGIALPILIAGLGVAAIVSLFMAAGEGMFSADSEMRKATKKRFVFIFFCLAIGLLASTLVLVFKNDILGIV